MTIETEILIAVIGALATVWAAFLTLRTNKIRSTEKRTQTLFEDMQSEIDRLRVDISDRDLQSRDNHVEIIQLRAQIQETIIEVFKLRALLSEVIAGAVTLHQQLLEAEIEPAFDPTTKQV